MLMLEVMRIKDCLEKAELPKREMDEKKETSQWRL
jgi:hypothetical protein